MARTSSGIWVTALATVLVLGMLAALLAIVAANALAWFWPVPVERVELADGTVYVGQPVERRRNPVTGGERLKFKIGARDLDGRDFVWVEEGEIRRRVEESGLVRVERTAYGDVFGRVEALEAGGFHPEAADLESLLEIGRRERKRLRKLVRRTQRMRRPLTRLEEKLALVERSGRADTPEGRREIAALERRLEEVRERLAPELEALAGERRDLEARLEEAGLVVDTGRGSVRIPLGHVVEVVPNGLSLPSRLGWALRHLVAFLFSEPREANTEGGIYPALFGTVLLVLLMSVLVMPLGVVTAVYMTEYATDGPLLRLATQAVQNLAGVPSIVFGMFGMAFFIYAVGGSVDRIFFADRLPTPTFGTGGILWASLTLALLTVPVVVVATREGLSAVPRDWRDAALALGATRWQTLRRIVIPAAMPGILTGLILAVSRAAGEVAPLMLTGAVKMAPSLPLDGTPPFLHLERKFMHLGFHIYDLSMQSPNVEAAKPAAFATTLVLLALVVALNLTAILVRRRLRRAFRGSVV